MQKALHAEIHERRRNFDYPFERNFSSVPNPLPIQIERRIRLTTIKPCLIRQRPNWTGKHVPRSKPTYRTSTVTTLFISVIPFGGVIFRCVFIRLWNPINGTVKPSFRFVPTKAAPLPEPKAASVLRVREQRCWKGLPFEEVQRKTIAPPQENPYRIGLNKSENNKFWWACFE